MRSTYGRSRRTLLSALLGLGLAWAPDAGLARTAGSYDLVIVRGRVIDPESGLDAVRNIGVSDGKIARISDAALKGARVIDARGLVVSPGFIDLHAHDLNPNTLRLHAQDGVTTALELESGAYPVEAWYARRTGVSPINFGASVSHAALRAIAFGDADPAHLTGEPEADSAVLRGKTAWRREASLLAQRMHMADMLASQLRKGGVGVGYHIATTPGADASELIHLFRAAARAGAPNFIHIRSAEQVTPTDAVAETIAAARTAGAGVHIVHLNSSALWETRNALGLIDEANASRVDVTTEAYPYTGAMTSFDDPRTSEEAMAAFRGDYSMLEFVPTGERLTKEKFAEYRKLHPHGEVLIAHVMRQTDVDLAIEHPSVMVASDGGAFQNGKGHPRGAGTFARIFSRYVRERKSLTLSEAIAKVSYLPARRLEAFVPGMRLRGRIREGAVADLTIFDPDKIADRATYRNGAAPSAGIAYVLVAGQPVVENHRFRDDTTPGQPIFGGLRLSADAPKPTTPERLLTHALP